MRQITLKVQAGKVEEIAVDGDYVRVKSAGVPVRIEAETGQVDATIEQGDALNLKPFKRLRVSHSDAAEQTITLMVGNGTSADSAKVGGSLSISGDVSAVQKTGQIYYQGNYAINAANTATRPVLVGRRYLFLQNVGLTNIFIKIGSAAVLNQGIKLVPDASFVMDSYCVWDGNVNAISDAAGGNLTVIEGV